MESKDPKRRKIEAKMQSSRKADNQVEKVEIRSKRVKNRVEVCRSYGGTDTGCSGADTRLVPSSIVGACLLLKLLGVVGEKKLLAVVPYLVSPWTRETQPSENAGGFGLIIFEKKCASLQKFQKVLLGIISGR
jgi:hypothetical protein